jgi:hypothetical protein
MIQIKVVQLERTRLTIVEEAILLHRRLARRKELIKLVYLLMVAL